MSDPIAKLYGKADIFKFKIEILGDIKAYDFLNVEHNEKEVLCQVLNVIRDKEFLLGECKVIGHREAGVLKGIRTPFFKDAKILKATDEFIKDVVDLSTNAKDFIGVLEHHPELRIAIDLKKTITKHIAVLAKSGAGKSYTVGVLLEEVMKKNIPIVILDPHNEYATLRYPNTNKKDIKRLEKFGLKANGFLGRVKEYSPDTNINSQCEEIKLDINTLKPQDLIDSLPQKPTPAQQSMVYNILSTLNNRVNFDELIFNISNEESNAKWSLISQLEQLKKLAIYSPEYTKLSKIVKHKQTSIISLKGVEPYIQDTFVTGLLKELFEARKKEEIPPFLLVLEEAHNFCPEKGIGSLKSSGVIRTIAGEGRKFGIGLCVISQRPAKVDKNVISQCTTQVLLKMTNPNDLKSVIASSEGVDSSSEEEIQKLNIGTCLLTGVIDIPLKVNIRPRITKHGGETVDITLGYEADEKNKENKEPVSQHEHFEDSNEPRKPQTKQEPKKEEKPDIYQGEHSEFIQFIAPEIEIDDAKVMLDTEQIEVQLVPATMVKVKQNGVENTLLFDKVNKKIIKNLFPFEGLDVSGNFDSLSQSERKLLQTILELEDKFNPAELLIKTDMMFNEILRVCDSLANKGLLRKIDKQFEVSGLKFVKELNDYNFFGTQKFEEVSYDIKKKESISTKDTNELFNIFGEVQNIKDIFILMYCQKN